MLRLVNVSKTHQAGEVRTTALDRVSCHIRAGEYVAITGPSGCGKSTLLNLLGLLDQPDTGECWFEENNVVGWSEVKRSSLRCRIGSISQNFNLIEDLSVYENVEMALEYNGVAAKQRRESVMAMLDKLGIAHRAKHRPSQLSGGQQQRVAIARALVARPAVLLADEPTGNLDSAHGEEVMKLLRAINDEGTTVVMVTHSPQHAAQADRVLQVLDGRIVDETQLAI